MKITKILGIAASLAFAAVITSCSDKGYWEEAPMKQGYSFACAQFSESLSPGAQEIKLTMRRSETATTESVDVTFTPGAGCPSDITVESPVVFQAGSNTADVIVRIADAQPPYTYSGTVAFSGDASYSGIEKCTLSMPVEYTWINIGKGLFYDAWVMDNATEEYPVEIMQAEGFQRYRVISPYKEYYTTIGPASWEDWIGSTGPSYIEFWENANGKLSFNSYNTGLYYQAVSTQPIGAYSWSAFSSGSYTGDYDVWYSPGFAVLSPVYYINGVGGYGQQVYAVQITLPE